MRTLILAGSFGEAARYARGKGLRHYRFASSAEAVANFQAQRVVELPGYARRSDKHSLNTIAQRVVRRGGEWIQDEYVPEPVPETPSTKLAAFTREDWLLGTVSDAGQRLTSDELREVGATEEEVAEHERVEDIAKTVVEPALDTAFPLENKGAGSTPEKEPKATKRVRRTKEQIAYDEALESWETNGGSKAAVLEARENLAARHPDDERLQRELSANDPFEA
jgi:hypothetical protein